jgi:GT2 family glycosyltransferase
VTGAFMFFDRDIFKSIGGFDISFFLDCEEEDISKRVWNAGKDVYMIPEPRSYP